MMDRTTILRSLMEPRYALELGKAAEHLVCADLILSGYRAFLSDQGLPYDVIADCGFRLIKIQVKAACFTRNTNTKGRTWRGGYTFAVRRRGKDQRGERLNEQHCDMVAFVALDIRAVAYLPITETTQTVQIMPPGTEYFGKYRRNRFAAITDLPFRDALKRCGEPS